MAASRVIVPCRNPAALGMTSMTRLLSALCFATLAAISGSAVGAPFDLSNYQFSRSFILPGAQAAEASAITWNWDNGNLFVLGDEGDALVEVSRAGTVVSTMTLTGFDDTEGLTYLGAGQFVITEERLQDAYLLTYTPGGSIARASLPFASLGPTVGNVGVEGISFDPLTGQYFFVKEKTPQAVNQASIDFGAGSAAVTSLFDPSFLNLLDLSDISVLSAVPMFVGTPDQNTLLIYSQESARLLAVSRAGSVLSSFDFAALSTEAEGVTIDANGMIYVAAESAIGSPISTVFVLTPVPEPSTIALMAGGLGILAWRVGRRRPGVTRGPTSNAVAH